MDRQRRDLTTGSLRRTLLTMALPIMAAQVLTSLYSLTDMFWLGKMAVGAKEALAAVGPTAALTFIVVAFGMGFGSGGTALVSQHTGARRHRDADVAAGQTILLLTCATAVASSLVFIFAPQVLRLLQTPPEVMPQALPFLRILLCSMPFIAFNIGYGSALRAIGDTLTMVLSSGAIMEPMQVMSRMILMYDLVSSFMQFPDPAKRLDFLSFTSAVTVWNEASWA